MQEPFSLSLEDIASLTPYQVRWIFFRTKADDPSLTGESQAPLSPKQIFWRVWREWRGFPEDWVRKKWALEVKKNPALAGH